MASVSDESPTQQRLMWEAAKKPEFKLNLGDLIKFGRDADNKTLLMSAMFLQKELPIRIGKRVQELQSLPVPMYSTKSVRELSALYEETFFRVLNHDPPNNSKAEQSFSDMLLNVRDKHKLVQANIAAGFIEMLRSGVPKWAIESEEIQDKLTRFYTGRIGVRLLMDQHLGLRRDAQDRSEQAQHKRGQLQQAFVGCVQTQCNLREIIEDAISDARDACKMHLKDCPTVMIEGREDISAPYIPEHLYIMVFEILKNSCRATVELHGRASTSHTPMYGEELPPCRVTISGGSDCFVKISDRGGGIPPQSLQRIWNFAHTTAPPGMQELAGFGHGLPLSRTYARYWGGDIEVMSMENCGVDNYIRLGVPAKFYGTETPDWMKREAVHSDARGVY